MGKKKVNLTWIIVSVILIATFLILWQTGALSKSKALAIGDVPTGCNVGGSGTTANEFICPSVCDVNGWDECITQTGEIPIVIFRTNANSLEDYNTRSTLKWIAINGIVTGSKFTKTSELHLYCVTSISGGSKISEIILDNNQAPAFNTRLYAYNGNLYVSTWAGREVLRMYELCDDKIGSDIYKVATSLQSVPAYKTTERFGGSSNPFQCSKSWKIENNGIKSSGTASYSSIATGKFETGTKRLSKNDTFIFNGKINYAIIDITNACAIDTCNDVKTGIIKCVKDSKGCPVKSTSINFCNVGEDCIETSSGAICQAPFETSIELGGFNTKEDIVFDYSVRSDRVGSVQITFKLVKSGTTSAIQIQGPTSISLPTTKTITFSNPGLTGEYQIVIEKSYNSISVTPEIYNFNIGNPLETNVKLPLGELTGSQIITNSPFYVDVGVSENGILIPDLVKVYATATLTKPDGSIVDLTEPIPVKKNDYLRYYFTLDQPGRFKLVAKAEKFGVFSNEESTSAEVINPKITIQFTNLAQIGNTKPGIKTIKFETKDAFDEYFNPDSLIVKITPSGASTGLGDIDVSNQITTTNLGKHELVYNFAEGSYRIYIKASKSGYPGFTEVTSNNFQIAETGTVKECGNSDDCPSGYICDESGQCIKKEPPITLYIIITASIILIIVFVFIIIRLSKKPKKTEISLGGGL